VELAAKRIQILKGAVSAAQLCARHRPVSIKRTQEKLAVSKQAASTAVKQLVSCKILTEKTGFKRNQVFAAEDVLKIYNKPA
jgi:DNA-binding transcriptional regulator GbsR (MarR family)